MYNIYKKYLNTLHNSGKYRKLGRISQDSQDTVLDFSTNDYLNLSRHPNVINAATINATTYGAGSTGSRLLSGNNQLYEEFEATIAADKHSRSSLIFNTGFQTNISTLSCLLDQKILNARPLVFFDKLNHSSLYQAVFLSKAELYRYRHNDLNHLEYYLDKYKNHYNPKFIVTETIFGMDGDLAPLASIVELANKHNAFLYLDEAHATGVFGVNGYGLSTTVNLQHIPHLIMGTFSKALGVSGGYIACDPIIKNFIINKATGFIYSTAPSPMLIGAAFKSWQLIKHLDQERNNLQNLANYLRQDLKKFGFNIGNSTTHIIPIILHDDTSCLKIQQMLLAQGIMVSSVRAPTVPPGTARLRIAITTQHTQQDLKKLSTTLKELINL